MLTGLTATFRVIAWLVHDATLATDQILPEVIFTFLFLYAATRLKEKTDQWYSRLVHLFAPCAQLES